MEREPNDTKRAYSNRAWAKCSECRRSKVKVSKNGSPKISLALKLMDSSTAQCTPRDREWTGELAQKCERCRSRKLPCGPNLIRDDDPKVFARRDDNGHEGQSNSTTGSPYDTTSTTSPSGPEGRDWETINEKCYYRAERNLPCGPTFTKEDDPEVGSAARTRLAFPAGSGTGREGSHQQDVQSANVVSSPSLHLRHMGAVQGPQIDESRLAIATSPKDRGVRIHDLSDKDLRAEALSM